MVTGTDEGKAHLWVLEWVQPDAPYLVGELFTNLPGADPFGVPTFRDVALNSDGTMAVVAASTYGVMTVDLRVPASPKASPFYDTPGTAVGVALNRMATAPMWQTCPRDYIF